MQAKESLEIEFLAMIPLLRLEVIFRLFMASVYLMSLKLHDCLGKVNLVRDYTIIKIKIEKILL